MNTAVNREYDYFFETKKIAQKYETNKLVMYNSMHCVFTYVREKYSFFQQLCKKKYKKRLLLYSNSQIRNLKMGSSVSHHHQEQQQQQQQKRQEESVSACPLKSKTSTTIAVQAAADSSSQCPMKATNTTSADKKVYKKKEEIVHFPKCLFKLIDID